VSDALRMPPIDLSDDDLARAAIAARAIARQHEEQSARHSGEIRAHFIEQCRRYRALAARFEQARQPWRGA
jgi:hypothetical protein